jgi:N-acetylmuramoyl-L-alanine amidase
VNPGFKETAQGRVYAPFQQAQIDQLILLLKDIVKRHNIAPGNILGHNDIAPQRKQDPGPMFPWKQLADAGLITWPEASRVRRVPGSGAAAGCAVVPALAEHGYAGAAEWRAGSGHAQCDFGVPDQVPPSLYDGTPDAETAALLDVLTSRCRLCRLPFPRQ